MQVCDMSYIGFYPIHIVEYFFSFDNLKSQPELVITATNMRHVVP